MRDIDIEKYINKGENIYMSAMIIAKRARKINQKISEELKSELGELENEEETDEENNDRIKIVDKFDKMPKPVEIAMNEFIEDKIKYKYKEDNE